MTRAFAIAAVAGLAGGLLAGFLWWGQGSKGMEEELRALQGQRVAAEVAQEKLKSAETKLKQTEEELRSERERRSRLESIISQGHK